MLERTLEIIISQSLFLYTEAYRGNVIYPLSGTAELKLRTSDSQYLVIQLLRSNAENKTPFNLLKDIKALGKKTVIVFFLFVQPPHYPALSFLLYKHHSTSSHYRHLLLIQGVVLITDNYIGASLNIYRQFP